MMIVVKPNSKAEEVQKLRAYLGEYDVEVQEIKGEVTQIFGIAGDVSQIDLGAVNVFECVDKIIRVGEPYKKANRKFHPENSIVDVGGVRFGGDKLVIMAGPCSIESEDQIFSVAQDVKKYGAAMLRGGAFKPRTSPYSFQGMGEDGLDLLLAAGRKTGLPVVSELTSITQLDSFIDTVDMIQIGARNMQNFELLKALGKTKKPILLKRGFSATIEEFLMSAEYIMAGGNNNVVLCERGIRTFETFTRNSLDLSCIPIIKRLSHLPIVVDPSHATGIWWMVEPMSKAAIAAGADGLIIEVHNNPKEAKCDGAQSLTPEAFASLMNKIKIIASVESREI